MTSRTLRGNSGKFVEKQHAVVRHADLAGSWDASSADKSRIGDRVMWMAKGTLGNEPAARGKQSRDGVDSRGLQAFFKTHRWKNRRDAFGQHRLAGSRRSDHQHVMSAGHRDFDRAFGMELSADVAKVFAAWRLTIRWSASGST